MRVKNLFLVIMLLTVSIAYSSSINDSGHISNARIWDADTVLVVGGLIVDSSSCLTISPGTYVEFQAHYGINVKGQLLAIGTQNDSIIFTAKDAKTGWKGIRFEETSVTNDSSRLVFCRLTYGRAIGTGWDSKGGAVFVYRFSKLRISNCTINKCTATMGGGIYCDKDASPLLIDNSISNDTASNCGGGIGCFDGSTPLIMNSVIKNNRAEFGGGVFNEGAYPTLINNRISNNSASQYGGGLNCFGSSPTIINCSIVYNQAVLGGGIHCGGYTPAKPKVINSILWGNSADSLGKQVCLMATDADPSFLFCDIQGGTTDFAGEGTGANYGGTFQNNIDSDPALITSSMELGGKSPCINAGTPDTAGRNLPLVDFAGNPRIHQERIDIGAYEYQKNISASLLSASSRSRITSFTHISFSSGSSVINVTVPDSKDQYTLIITNAHGRIVEKLTMNAAGSGGSIGLDGSALSFSMVPAGVYFCMMRVNGVIAGAERIVLTR